MRQLSVFRLIALSLVAMGAMAQSDSTFKFSGFGSLTATKSSEKNADFTSNFAQPNGPGFTRNIDLGLDSKVGLQASLPLGESFSALVQVITERRFDDTYDPYLSLAQLKFQAASWLSFRAGRLPFSAYLISDYKKVGYSTPWVRPPVEVYQFNPLTYVDGADLQWQTNAGETAFSGSVFGGSSSAKLAASAGNTSEFKAKDLVGASVTATHGSATFRVFYVQMKGTLDNTYLDGPSGPYALLNYNGLVPTGMPPPAPADIPNPYYDPALASQYQIKNDKITYASVGFNYDPGDWFVMLEATRNAGDVNQLPQDTSAYITGGYRFGAWTPYLTFGSKKTDSPSSSPNAIVDAILAGGLNAQSSLSGGVRWDCYKNMALKAQYDHVSNATRSAGALVNTQPAFKPGGTYNLATICLDFVF